MGGSKWDRELTALAGLCSWAEAQELVLRNPVAIKEMIGRSGAVIRVPAARAKDAEASNVKRLAPRSWRRWVKVGLRGTPGRVVGREGSPLAAGVDDVADGVVSSEVLVQLHEVAPVPRVGEERHRFSIDPSGPAEHQIGLLKTGVSHPGSVVRPAGTGLRRIPGSQPFMRV